VRSCEGSKGIGEVIEKNKKKQKEQCEVLGKKDFLSKRSRWIYSAVGVSLVSEGGPVSEVSAV